jgi:hypothetical protein
MTEIPVRAQFASLTEMLQALSKPCICLSIHIKIADLPFMFIRCVLTVPALKIAGVTRILVWPAAVTSESAQQAHVKPRTAGVQLPKLH